MSKRASPELRDTASQGDAEGPIRIPGAFNSAPPLSVTVEAPGSWQLPARRTQRCGLG